ncbi:hypothetical protein PanWU01x14_346580 [Parasponia andersonii]|uniref:Uncharacterized protein n=1 Tax=Parasponia andersonii TaxID=3476 RepID=A0A2P5AC96_PARAD|nr:hypothetical protein PanWU01x14_346580 [Parasponia andersonii]
MGIDLKRIAELNNKGMYNFGENIPLSFHVINMVLLNNGVFSHNLHGIDPITITTITTTTTTTTIIIIITRTLLYYLLSHLKHLPKRTLSHNSQNLKIPGPNLHITSLHTLLAPLFITNDVVCAPIFRVRFVFVFIQVQIE